MNNIKFINYTPGAIGRITELHARYYHLHWEFDINFETQVARELSDFLLAYNPGADFFITAVIKDEIIGSIAIDGKNAASVGARLRWFIVGSGYSGTGIGSALMEKALGFCGDAGHGKVFLWTFKGLDAARKIYERRGFLLVDEHEDAAWGNMITHQKFELNFNSNENSKKVYKS